MKEKWISPVIEEMGVENTEKHGGGDGWKPGCGQEHHRPGCGCGNGDGSDFTS